MKNKLLFLSILIVSLNNLGNTQTWEELTLPQFNTDSISETFSISGFDNAVYLCSDLGLFASQDNGISFTNLTFGNGPTANLPIRSAFMDVISNVLYAGGDSSIFKSTDNGGTWTETSAIGLGFINKFERIDNTIVAVHGDFSGASGIVYSDDEFSTFSNGNIPNNGQVKGLLVSDNSLIASGYGGIFRSADKGANFSQIGIGYPTTGTNFWNVVESNNMLFAGDVWGKGLYRSADMGATWVYDSINFNDFCQVFDMESGRGAVLTVQDGACNNGEAIKISTDGGATWTSALYNLIPAFYNQLGRNADGSCFFAYARFEKKLYRLCDAPLQLNEAEIASIQVFPNPTSGVLHLNNIEKGTVNLYDLHGKLLKSFMNSSNSLALDLSGYDKGSYFLHILNNKGSKTFKVIKN